MKLNRSHSFSKASESPFINSRDIQRESEDCVVEKLLLILHHFL